MNYGHGHGHGSLSQGTGIAATPPISTPEITADQFADVNEETSESAITAITMPHLEDAGSLKGAAVPDTGTYKPAGNKFTRSYSPNTDEDDSEVEPPPSSQKTLDSSQCQWEHKEQTMEDNPPTPWNT